MKYPVDIKLPCNDKGRILTLNDGTKCNPTGNVTFIGVSNGNYKQGCRYEISDIKVGEKTGIAFIGIDTGGSVKRASSDKFIEGKVND